MFDIIEQVKKKKGTIENQALSSLHGGSHDITLTVPVSQIVGNYKMQLQFDASYTIWISLSHT